MPNVRPIYAASSNLLTQAVFDYPEILTDIHDEHSQACDYRAQPPDEYLHWRSESIHASNGLTSL
jgi:hypothetical protein